MRNTLLASTLVLAIALLVAGCPRPPEKLEANFGADVTSGVAPLTVEFTDLSTEGDASITSWLWDFGDGEKGTSTEQDPSHTYMAAGAYDVSLTVTTANDEDTESKRDFITVTQGGEGEGEGETETILLPGNVPLVMVRIPSGTFWMGRYSGEQGSLSLEDPRHQVTVPGFWMGKYELTKAQWTAVMGTTPWFGNSYVLNDPNSPAEYVSWNNAQSFITALNTYTGLTFRLPSEAEWEYACRAGTTTRFYWGDDPSYTVGNAYCWWRYNAWDVNEKYAHVVGQKTGNAWGLYDMSGNVWEWCQDWWHSSYTGAPADGSAWELPTDSYRVGRGGGSYAYGKYCRSADRGYNNPSYDRGPVGFRLCR